MDNPAWSAAECSCNIVYAGAGDNFSDPATSLSDSVVAFDLPTGKILWSKQLTAGDVYNMACSAGRNGANCPEKAGPDFDIGLPRFL